jgi:DedD protein
MATRSEAHDPAVDELRRRARRRLIGAIVLALAAAVLLPLLLESEPKPLGDDVSIQIPPIDTGKFINPLSPGAPDPKVRSDGAVVSVPAPAVESSAAQSTEGNDATAASPSGSAPAASGVAPAPTPTSPMPSPKAPETKPAAPESQPGASPTPTESKPDAKPASTDAKSAPAKTSGAFVVQVAAFSDSYGARALVIKLKRGGFPGYTEAVATDKGTLHRVRVGPYTSRDVADSARARLKAAGFDGVVTRNG